MRYGINRQRSVPIAVYFMRGIIIIILSLLFYCAYALSETLPSVFAHGDTIIVQIDGLAQPPGFFPNFLTLHVNDTVVFVNNAYPPSSYTIIADDGSFSSPSIGPRGQWKITFLSKGAHVYRDATDVQRMVGELLIVDPVVHLLPTPNPLIEATVIATINERKNLPDTIVLPVHKQPAPSSSSVPLIILVIVISGGLIVLGAAGFAYYQRYQQRSVMLPDEDQSGPLPGLTFKERIQQVRKIMYDVKQKIQARPPFRHRSGEDDDDEDWDQL